MGRSVLVVLAPERDALLARKVAGLTFADRLRKSASHAGFDSTLFVPGNDSGGDGDVFREWSKPSGETCLVLLKKGYLPDARYLESLRTLGRSAGQFMTGANSPALVYRTDNPGEWLEKVSLYRDASDLFVRLFAESGTTTVPIKEGKVYKLDSAERIPEVEKLLFNALVKDTEGFMSKHVERKISLAISRRLVDAPITPNQMSIVSILIGLVGAVFLGARQGFCQVLGACLFLAHSILDGCDGELARIRFQQSRFGGLLDYWGDNVVHSAVFFALGFEWSRRAASVYPYVLAGLAIFGTLASAGWIYWNTMREKSDKEPLYTSVSASEEKSATVKVVDFLSRRDFIYLVIVLAIFRKLDWFLGLGAAGAPFFFLVLLWIHFREKSARSAPSRTH
ncbi:MAG: CDP-alcohol phosphatidyltransferase family protein [Nitrospinae bacterium]|nr:CDP-alcohol phosphatidyltransferase family protein [Nitrospinota bacterium]